MNILKARLFRNWKAVGKTIVSNIMPYRNIRISNEQWDKEYSSGHWDYLHSLQQLMRYKVIAGYCGHFSPRGTFLDVGCGDGYLQEVLAVEGYSRYLGIDVSAEAINSINHRQNETTHFLKVDINGLQLEERFDVIIFNESLYYFEEPLPILRKYASFLSEKGFFVISMYGLRSVNERIWKLIEAKYPVVDEVNITHGSGKCWTIKVLKI